MKLLYSLGVILFSSAISAAAWAWYAYVAWRVLDWFTPFAIQYRTILGVEIAAIATTVAFTHKSDDDSGDSIEEIVWKSTMLTMVKALIFAAVLGQAWVLHLIVR